MSAPPWVLPAVSFILLGASLTTFINVLLGGSVAGNAGGGIEVAWAICATTAISGAACLFVSTRQHQLQGMQVKEVIQQMEIIEERFEGGAA